MEDKFEESVLECVDRGLDAVGESTKKVLYWQMKQGNNLERSEIVQKHKEFLWALRSMFGNGSKYLESHILTEIKVAFGGEPEVSGTKTLEEALNVLRTKIRNGHS